MSAKSLTWDFKKKLVYHCTESCFLCNHISESCQQMNCKIMLYLFLTKDCIFFFLKFNAQENFLHDSDSYFTLLVGQDLSLNSWLASILNHCFYYIQIRGQQAHICCWSQRKLMTLPADMPILSPLSWIGACLNISAGKQCISSRRQ